ncbi:MAG TPA: putative heme d1 biosynthesis radical SAM protein NirJ2 [Methylomusa anaerophila]|uniref:Antilisterial bacteriocin subtilosin biosynthesis protein AlbA n=1 Tax=Methylomusa anaerophila TaxID=1930071 RepID=A0A348ANU5_9FIRM|nr:putative heme d1 biosynthesis radical SAM protein NirJ2 [Methylomusa anaerophila]BBB92743.1 antilisterial bacteriocin subtilosin biosynthesis protein AlbA [Methylomusa anaerophila]HML87404.1 putative heme d1 biosynthesis radical SAM protein NirJ2 [Methylomusa anaerophila]
MIISWNTTQQCNINCIHCYRDAGPKRPDELTTEEGKKLLNEIAKVGFKIMIFSGGEPLLRQDIYELISHATSIGLRPVIGTNGIMITEEVAAKLKSAGVMTVGISVDSGNPEKHDWFRGYKGAWEQTMAGIAACRQAGLPFQIHTTVLNWNEHEITKITDTAVELGAVAHHIFFLVPTGRGKDIEDTTLKTTQYENLLEQILDKQAQVPIELKPTCAPQFMRIAKERNMQMRYTRGCLAGTAYCVILPNGDVQPCPYLPLKAGNVRQTDFDIIWRESPMFNELRNQPLKGACGSCGFDSSCGGCRARAYYYSGGDYMAEEPWCSCGRS